MEQINHFPNKNHTKTKFNSSNNIQNVGNNNLNFVKKYQNISFKPKENSHKNRITVNTTNRDLIRPSVNGKYNLNFIDWNNEWERVSEIERKIENEEEISDKEEEERVRSHMIKNQSLYSPGVSVENFLLITKPDRTKECYICLKNFSANTKIRKLPCNHMFCEVCLIPWFKSNCVCPTCKYNLKIEEEEEEDNYNY